MTGPADEQVKSLHPFQSCLNTILIQYRRHLNSSQDEPENDVEDDEDEEVESRVKESVSLKPLGLL